LQGKLISVPDYLPGNMQTEGEANPLKFSQVFHLAATGGSFVITNG
jgi:hypothetical protein